MEVNWEKEASNNPVYPTGTYKVRIKATEPVTASTGTQQIRWKAEIISPEEHAGRSMVDHTALTEKALWRLANMVNAAGVDLKSAGVTDTNSPAFQNIVQSCVGRTMYWRNEQGTNPNTGAPKNNIVEYIQDSEQAVLKPADLNADMPDSIAWDDK
jgi:hypothetical protein